LKQIPLTRGFFALVDDEDYEELSKHKWHINSNGYAFRNVRLPIVGIKRYKQSSMHREIVGLKSGDKRHTDHINQNKLDNRRSNLRICTCAENQRNKDRKSNNTSGFKGVSWTEVDCRWRAKITVNGKHKFLGHFLTPEAAHEAYCKAALELHGEFASPGQTRPELSMAHTAPAEPHRKRKNKTGFRGVYKENSGDFWTARIWHNGVCVHLGRFNSAEQANLAYCEATQKIRDGASEIKRPAPIRHNETGYAGVKRSRSCSNRWEAYIKINGKQKYLGSFSSPELAHEAHCKARAIRDGAVDVNRAAA
jgi:hypothetical protein